MRLLGIYILIEIIFFVLMAKIIGFGLTFLMIIASAIAGTLIMRMAGFSTLLGVRQKIQLNQDPDKEMLNGLLLGVGGLLLFLPGLLGDMLGILLVIPATRPLFIRFIKKLFIKYSMDAQQGFTKGFSFHSKSTQQQSDIIEGEWVRKDK